MPHLIDYSPRIDPTFLSDKIKQVLPEHFSQDYPNLILFLEKYYDTLFEDDKGFSYIIQSLYMLKDLNETLLIDLDNLYEELGINLTTNSVAINPREFAKIIHFLYNSKSSRLSAELFFKSFYGEDPIVSYPKNNMFIVGDSKIGPDSLKFIQDDKRYQNHSILITSSIPLAKWKDQYKKYIHPIGFYIAGDTLVESTANLSLNEMPIAIPDIEAQVSTYELSAGLITIGSFSSATLIIPDDSDADSYAERISPNITLLNFSGTTLEQFDDQYDNFVEGADENSPTFDEDSDGIIKTVDFSNEFETMDKSVFDTWDSANNTFQYLDSA